MDDSWQLLRDLTAAQRRKTGRHRAPPETVESTATSRHDAAQLQCITRPSRNTKQQAAQQHPPSSLKSQVARSCRRCCAARASNSGDPQPQQRVARRHTEAALSGCSCRASFLYTLRTCW